MGDATSEATSPYSTSGMAYTSIYEQQLNEAMAHSQANHHQILQGEPSECSHQSRPGCHRAKMSEAQRRERKRLIDQKYRQHKREKTEWLSTENRHLKEENRQLKVETGQLTLENKHLKEHISRLQVKGQLAAEVLQSQDSYISQSTSQVDHQSFHVQDHYGMESNNEEAVYADCHCLDSNHEATVDGFDGLEINDLQSLLMESLPENEMILNGRVAMNEYAPDKTEQSGLRRTQMAMTEFLSKLDAEVMSKVDSSDFSGLEVEQRQVGRYSFPLSLIPIVERINNSHGDISARCLINPRISGAIYVLFCATIKEMDDLQLEEVTENRMLKWRDAIKDALRLNFDVRFAMEHLKKIACAYFGLQGCLLLQHINERISKLEAEVNDWKKKHAKIYEESKSVIAAAEEFIGVPVSTGLFP